MTRLLVFGFVPLPFENEKKNYGPGIRAWQFMQPLSCDIRFIGCRIPFVYEGNLPRILRTEHGHITSFNLAEKEYRDPRLIQDLHDEFNPDAILAATIFSTSVLPSLKTTAPIWIDLFGHVMAEAQAKMHRYRDNSFLTHFLEHELKALHSGDCFSTVSNAQALATAGELGLIGRLTAETTGYQFCHTIPCAIDPEPLTHLTRRVRGIDVPDDAFIVLWSGGFNTWTDIPTLVSALDNAMRRVPKLYFVSTGGAIKGHDEITYAEFCRHVDRSPNRDRFILKGWLPKAEVGDYYFEADIGINIDHFMYEGLFGSKNRVMDWMRAGLPALIGELCELSRTLPAKGYAFSYPLHQPEALADAIVDLATHPEKLRSASEAIRTTAIDEYSFSNTTRPFQRWLKAPSHAPDQPDGRLRDLPIVITSREYLSHLENEASNRNKHIVELEHYIHHIESEIRKHQQTGSGASGVPLTPARSAPDLTLPKPDPLTSILIVSWNGMNYLKECIESIRSQDYKNIEICIIDNASHDGSADYIDRSFPDVRLIRNPKNLGFARGVNRGITHCKGDVIVLLNQDTVLLQGCIRALIEELVSQPKVAIAGSKILDPDKKHLQHAGGIVHPNGLTNHLGAGEPDEGQYDLNQDCEYVTGACLAFKRQLIDWIGVLDERFHPAYFEELDFCLRTIRAGFRVRYVSGSSLLHFESTSTGKLSRRFYTMYHRNRLKFILKHHNIRYLLGTFRRFEIDWIRQFLPREQVIPLLNAYGRCLPLFGWAMIRGFLRRTR